MAGYKVINVTLPEYDVCTYEPPPGVYGILAGPPCTQFSLARTTAKTPRDLAEGMKCVRACMNIIWTCRERGELEFWAIENPVGYLRQFLGQPAMTFDPWEYGDPYTKKTDLWGYFNIPKKLPITLDEQDLFNSQMNTRDLSDIPGTTVAARRAVTPAKFAMAFFKANR